MPDKDSPLIILAKKLLSLKPPSLSVLIARLGEMEDYEDFIKLVREFLPERENDILRRISPSEQMAAFAGYFEDRYFPLAPYLREGGAEEYGELTYHVPVIIRGFSYEDYHDIANNWRAGIQLMTYLIQNPYGDSDARVSLAEACQEHVPAALLQQVPEGGFSPEELHKLLDKTEHRALVLWADAINLSTGNVFLDTDDEMYGYSNLPDWDKEEVSGLTEEWHRADLIDEQIGNMAEWLEIDEPAHFEELLNFIRQRREEVNDGASDKRDKGEASASRSYGEYPHC